MVWNDADLIKVLQDGGVAVMPTDTLYGIVGKALSETAVNRIYAIRKRDPKKPCMVLIGDISELKKFSIVLSEEQENKIKEFWSISAIADIDHQRATSIVLDCLDKKFSYLHRGTNTLAFRLPAPQALRGLLLKVGSLIAPSANLETFPPSETIEDAKKYFGDKVDLYMDGGTIRNKASKLIKLHKDGATTILRA